MAARKWGFPSVVAVILSLVACAMLAARGPRLNAHSLQSEQGARSQPEPAGHIASQSEIARAFDEWSGSAHADTYDEGMGANSTCARCKSPLNWDPGQELAQMQALDCGSCKRVPGAPRPELPAGVRLAQSEWRNITCDICHMPAGDSYYTGLAFWNQAAGAYEAVEKASDLCEHCHEGRHGFHVFDEMAASEVHQAMECTFCHGSHGRPAACTDCHDPRTGRGAPQHARHPSVNCAGCHDGGRLSIWHESDENSPHFGQYITIRFAHTLTAWPSHDLTPEVDCERCHHPLDDRAAALVPTVRCNQCHEHEHGAVSLWCVFLQRDPDPTGGLAGADQEP